MSVGAAAEKAGGNIFVKAGDTAAEPADDAPAVGGSISLVSGGAAPGHKWKYRTSHFQMQATRGVVVLSH